MVQLSDQPTRLFKGIYSNNKETLSYRSSALAVIEIELKTELALTKLGLDATAKIMKFYDAGCELFRFSLIEGELTEAEQQIHSAVMMSLPRSIHVQAGFSKAQSEHFEGTKCYNTNFAGDDFDQLQMKLDKKVFSLALELVGNLPRLIRVISFRDLQLLEPNVLQKLINFEQSVIERTESANEQIHFLSSGRDTDKLRIYRLALDKSATGIDFDNIHLDDDGTLLFNPAQDISSAITFDYSSALENELFSD